MCGDVIVGVLILVQYASWSRGLVQVLVPVEASEMGGPVGDACRSNPVFPVFPIRTTTISKYLYSQMMMMMMKLTGVQTASDLCS